MKESWLYYDYLRRWWWLLLLGPVLGALAGLSYYSSQLQPIESAVTATIAIQDPNSGHGKPTYILTSLDSGFHSTVEKATNAVESQVATMVRYTNGTAVLRELSIDQRGNDEPWWKAVVLGSVIGILLAIGGIYVWEDAQAYQRHRQQISPVNQ